MYKNQLQELAQRSCFNLPSYTCIREGPDHAPRFKATVSFNGEVFESPGFHPTLRQAEHAAAEAALSSLSTRGPTQSLAARILDETGVCKNLLQEIAQRAGVSLPVYTTIRTGAKHMPLFKCIVEIGGRNFKGEPAKTKKQAEKNAASAAWTALKQLDSMAHTSSRLRDHGEANGNVGAGNLIQLCHMDNKKPFHQFSPSHTHLTRHSMSKSTAKERSPLCREHSVPIGQNFYPSSLPTAGPEILNFDSNPRMHVWNQPPVNPPVVPSYELGQSFPSTNQQLSSCHHPSQDAGTDLFRPAHVKSHCFSPQHMFGGSSSHQGRRHQRRHSLSGMESPMPYQVAMISSRASGGANMQERVVLHSHHPRIRGLPYQSLSERFELTRSLHLEDLHHQDEDDYWYSSKASPLKDPSYFSIHPGEEPIWRKSRQSQSDRFEMKAHQWNKLQEVHAEDDEEWLCHASGRCSSHSDKEKSCDEALGLQGWVKGDHSFVNKQWIPSCGEGWLRGDALDKSFGEESRHGYNAGWLCDRISNQNHVEEITPSLRFEHHSHCKQEGWPCMERPLEKDASFDEGLIYINQVNYNKKPTHNAASQLLMMASPLPLMSSEASPFSSLWSKSAQWLASPILASTSSAAAAVANSLGFSSARSSAPAVRVRQMVPVCSAPPPRRADIAFSSDQLPDNDSSLIRREAGIRDLTNKVRL